MAKIELNIVALGDFSSVNAQIKALQAQVELLNNSVGNVSLSSNLSKSLSTIANDFTNAMTASGKFKLSTVQTTTELENFGASLQKGNLGLKSYFQILTNQNTAATQSVKALAVEQTKLQNSIVMADPSKQGFYSVLTPTKIDEVANATKIAANEQNIYNIAVNKGSQALINWGKNTQWAGRQLTVGMSIPLILFGSQAVSAFDSVNTALTQLQKVYGEGLTPPSQNSINQISQQVLTLGRNMASTLGITQEFTVQVATSFAAMGKMGTDLTTMTEQTDRLAKLGNLDQQTATNAVIALQNVYKLSTTGLADAVNYFGAVQKQTSLSMTDLVQAESKVGPIIHQLGGSYKDTATMVLAMKEAGVPAAQAANALKSAFASIIAPTSAANKEFAAVGINLSSIKNAGGPVQMIEALQAGLKPLQKMQQEQLIEKLFGKYQFSRISALLANFNQGQSQTVNAIKVAGATSAQLAGLANQELQQATSSPSAQWQKAMATLKADLYPVGQKIIEIGTGLLKFGNAISKLFQGLPGPIKTVMGAIAIGVALSGPIIMMTGLMANFVGYLVKTVFNLKQLATGGKTLGQLLTPELIAAQNANKLFNDGLISSVDEVDLLTASINRLTEGLSQLVSTMNVGAGVSDLTSAVGAVATAETRIYEQMSIPGFATGRLPGFAAGVVPGSGSGNVDTFPAMLAPGEAVIPAAKTRKYYPLLHAIMTDKVPGFSIGTEGNDPRTNESMILNIGHGAEEHSSSVLEQLRSLISSGSLKNRLTKTNKATTGSLWVIPQSINQNVRGGARGMSGSAIASDLEEMDKAGVDATEKAKNLANKIGVSADQLVDAHGKLKDTWLKMINQFKTTDANTIFGSPNSKGVNNAKIRAEAEGKAYGGTFEKYVDDAMSPTTKSIIGGKTANGSAPFSLHEIQMRTVGTRGEMPGKTTAAGGGSRATGNTYGINRDNSLSSFSESEMVKAYPGLVESDVATKGGQWRGISGIKKVGKNAGEAIDKATREAIKAASPSKVAEETGKDYIAGLQQGAQQALPGFEDSVMTSMTSTASNFDEKGNYIWAPVGENISQSIAKGVESSNTVVENAVVNQTTGAMNKVKGMLTKEGGGMNMSGKMLGSMALMSAGPMISNMLPQGSLASSAVSNATNFAGMGMMLGPEGAAAGAALGILTSVFQNAANDIRQQSNNLKASVTISSVAAQQFGVSFKSISEYDFSKTTDGLTSHAQSVADNKVAVDSLTQAYMSATDQMTKDQIKTISGLSKKDLLTQMNKTYNADIAGGLTQNQAKQDIVSQMRAAGKNAYDINYVKNNLTNPSNVGEAFNNVVKYASKNLTNTGKAMQNLDPRYQAAVGSKQFLQGQIADLQGQQKSFTGDPTVIKNLQKQIDKYQKALDQVNQELDPTASKTSLLSDETVNSLSTNLQQLTTGPVKNLDQALKSLTAAGNANQNNVVQNEKVYDSLAASMSKSWGGFDKLAAKYKEAGGNTTGLSEAITMLNSGLISQANITAALESKDPTAITKLWTQNLAAMEKTQAAQVAASGTGGTGGTNSTPFAGTTQQLNDEKILKLKLSSQTKLKSAVDNQLKQEQKITKELQDQQNFMLSQFDLSNKMRTARASGDFMSAALLQQQSNYAANTYANGTLDDQLQNKSDAMADIIDTINTGLGDLQDAISSSSTAISQNVKAALGTQVYGANLKPTITIPQSSVAAPSGEVHYHADKYNLTLTIPTADVNNPKKLASDILAELKKQQGSTYSNRKVGSINTAGSVIP